MTAIVDFLSGLAAGFATPAGLIFVALAVLAASLWGISTLIRAASMEVAAAPPAPRPTREPKKPAQAPLPQAA
ncbi:MAG: hypothetical protein AAF909_15955 [Pseudomonadota bacterium]